MPLAGKGMLLTSMDIDAADEADFNRWYDREHLEERVAIDGTDVSAISTLLAANFTGTATPAPAKQISSGIYNLMWDLAKSDLPKP